MAASEPSTAQKAAISSADLVCHMRLGERASLSLEIRGIGAAIDPIDARAAMEAVCGPLEFFQRFKSQSPHSCEMSVCLGDVWLRIDVTMPMLSPHLCARFLADDCKAVPMLPHLAEHCAKNQSMLNAAMAARGQTRKLRIRAVRQDRDSRWTPSAHQSLVRPGCDAHGPPAASSTSVPAVAYCGVVVGRLCRQSSSSTRYAE